MPLPAVARYLCFHGGRGDGALNRGLAAFKDELSADALAMKRVGLGIVSCKSVRMLADFHTPDLFQPLLPSAAGESETVPAALACASASASATAASANRRQPDTHPLRTRPTTRREGSRAVLGGATRALR